MKQNKSKPLVIIQCYEDRQQTLPLRKAEQLPADVVTNIQSHQKREATDNPPPPPPMPMANGMQNGEHKKADPPTVNELKAELIKMNFRNGLTRTPTPDYGKTNGSTKNGKEDKAELDSIDSYKMKSPATVQPKPPSNYFVRAPNGTATMKKLARPVSVTIGEYTSNGRREPSKLEFLNGDKVDGSKLPDDESISNRLQSELALTLSRSNLKKKTESLNAVNKRSVVLNEDSDSSLDKNFHARYGNNILPLPPMVTIPKVTKLKH